MASLLEAFPDLFVRDVHAFLVEKFMFDEPVEVRHVYLLLRNHMSYTNKRLSRVPPGQLTPDTLARFRVWSFLDTVPARLLYFLDESSFGNKFAPGRQDGWAPQVRFESRTLGGRVAVDCDRPTAAIVCFLLPIKTHNRRSVFYPRCSAPCTQGKRAVAVMTKGVVKGYSLVACVGLAVSY